MLTKKEVKDKILNALEELIKNDYYLLIVEINERALTHRLAIYLGEYFPEYHVDCEYNRDGLHKKTLYRFKKRVEADDTGDTTVYPDIIIHKRGTSDNLVVIEAKKLGIPIGRDEKKLKAYKKDLGYRYAFLVTFPVKKAKENIIKINCIDLIRPIE